MRFDFLIVGSGLFGATFAQQCKEKGKTCLVIEKNNHIGGNCYTEKIHNIDVHQFGPHIFNTNNKPIWDYVQQFSKFIQYAHKVKVNYKDKIYSMPINLQTLYEIYGVKTPEEAKKKIEDVRIFYLYTKNLEEWCLSQIGPDLYNIFIKGYTTKQWKKDPKDLPASIIKRLPIRFNFDDRWHQSAYSGIPANGYTELIKNMLDGIQVELSVDYFRKDWSKYADKIVYTGPVDKLFNYEFGKLEYKTLRFETKTFDMDDYQGVSQMNYTDENVPYTRTVEHKHFNYKPTEKTVVTWEYPETWKDDSVPYYPLNDDLNSSMYNKYKQLLVDKQNKIIVGGRLGSYKYFDMDATIASALKLATNFDIQRAENL